MALHRMQGDYPAQSAIAGFNGFLKLLSQKSQDFQMSRIKPKAMIQAQRNSTYLGAAMKPSGIAVALATAQGDRFTLKLLRSSPQPNLSQLREWIWEATIPELRTIIVPCIEDGRIVRSFFENVHKPLEFVPIAAGDLPVAMLKSQINEGKISATGETLIRLQSVLNGEFLTDEQGRLQSAAAEALALAIGAPSVLDLKRSKAIATGGLIGNRLQIVNLRKEPKLHWRQ